MTDFDGVEARLRAILDPYRDRLVATVDGPGGLSLYLPGLADKPHGYVCGVRRGKKYVSFYLMPVYAFPETTESASSALLARRQGKSCFNFAKVDEALIGELADITGRSIERYMAAIAAGAGPFGDAARFEPARVALAQSAR